MTIRKGMLYGTSATAIFAAGIGPRIALAPPDEGGTGAGADSQGAGAAPAADAAPAAPASEGTPSALAGGVAKAAEGKAADDAAAAADAAKVEGADKVKPADPANPGEEKKEGEAEPPADAVVKDVDGNPIPDKYEIKMPDGMEMDAKLMEVAAPLFKEHKMSPAQAQAMTDLYTKVQGDAIKAHNDEVSKWLDDAKKDPEIGGAKYDESIAKAGQAFRAFADERALQIFDTYGLGNHPSILRTFARIGMAMGEGSTVLPGSGTGRVSDAQAMYPSMTK